MNICRLFNSKNIDYNNDDNLYYTIQPGETKYSIAKTLDIFIDEINNKLNILHSCSPYF